MGSPSGPGRRWISAQRFRTSLAEAANLSDLLELFRADQVAGHNDLSRVGSAPRVPTAGQTRCGL
jgi:hypothetical protein